MKKSLLPSFLTGALVFIVLVGLYGGKNADNSSVKEVSYKELITLIDDKKEQKELQLTQRENGMIYLADGKKMYVSSVSPNANVTNDILKKYPVDYAYVKSGSIFSALFTYILLPCLILYLLLTLGRRGGKGLKKTVEKEKTMKRVTLDEVGGLSPETENEVRHLLKLIDQKELALHLGIKQPKGALLHGPPGTGKTLLAKAIAGELGATVYSVGGSSFMEMYVGVGASRVRELFETARKTKPSLIFIDEIDAIAGKRGNAYRNEERENTLNELLKQLDGTEDNEGVFVVAATNRLDILDDAIVRPGRFDYKIHIGLPDKEGRKEILDIHAKTKRLTKEASDFLPTLAKECIGYSGADLESLFLLAGNHAFGNGREEISVEDFHFAIDRITLGNEGRKTTNKETLERVAIHEAGHALLALLADPKGVRKATIVPRGGALGFVAPLPNEDVMQTRSTLVKRLAMILAGGVAEKAIYGEHSIGVSGDVKQAVNLIDAMVENGMTTNAMQLVFGKEEKEKAKQTLFNEAFDFATDTILEKLDTLKNIANALIEKETIEGEDLAKIVYPSTEKES